MPSVQSRVFRVIIRIAVAFFMNDYFPKRYLRFMHNRVLPLLSHEVPGVHSEPVDVSGIPAEWLVPEGAAGEKAILYFHGGAYVLGSVASHRNLAARIGLAAGLRVLIIDYRLAPEHPFPAAVEDAVAACRWLLARGYSPGEIVFAGDSAGGGLALAAMLSLRDAGEPMPAGAMLLSPWTDLEVAGGSVESVGRKDPMIRVGSLRKDGLAYLGGADPKNPLAAPVHADLRGLPPLHIQAGTVEVLLDDSTRLARNAREDGIEVELDVWEGMFHVWQVFAPLVPESVRAIEALGAFARAKTG